MMFWMNLKKHYVEWKQPDTEYKLYDPIYMKFMDE